MPQNRALTLLIFIAFLLSGKIVSFAQEQRTEILVVFPVNAKNIVPGYGNNAEQLEKLKKTVGELKPDSTRKITSVEILGSSSPDGGKKFNARLAESRMTALENYVRSLTDFPLKTTRRSYEPITVDSLATLIRQSDLADKAEALKILRRAERSISIANNDKTDSRLLALKQLNGGRTWREINRRFFSIMRNAAAVVITFEDTVKALPEPLIFPVTPAVFETGETSVGTREIIVDTAALTRPFTAIPVALPSIPTDWNRRIYLKSNTLPWLMFISNIAAEIDINPSLSFSLPIYYSGINFFTLKVKMRTFGLQPELRYWFNKERRFYLGAHLGLAYFNVALGGDYRYQDHGARNPALGGGFSAGCRIPLSKNGRWATEFTIGAGIYDAHYDRFVNKDNGKLVDTQRKTFFGIDNAAVTLSYSFDLKKRSRR